MGIQNWVDKLVKALGLDVEHFFEVVHVDVLIVGAHPHLLVFAQADELVSIAGAVFEGDLS